MDTNLSPGLRLVGIGNFDGNTNTTDLVWENDSSPSYSVGQKVFWYMNSSWTRTGSAAPDNTTLPFTPTGWITAAVGDYGQIVNGSGVANGNRDGKSDLIVFQPSTRNLGIWILDGVQQKCSPMMTMNSTNVVLNRLSPEHGVVLRILCE